MSYSNRTAIFIRDFVDIKINQRIDKLAPIQPSLRMRSLQKRKLQKANEDAAIDCILELVGKQCRSTH